MHEGQLGVEREREINGHFERFLRRQLEIDRDEDVIKTSHGSLRVRRSVFTPVDSQS